MKISVCLITYNQEKFIERTIRGILEQEIDCRLEVVIGDDASTDNTGEICAEFAGKHPDLLVFRRRETNLGMMGNLIATLSECTGEYIAICEGDDYWINREKLQKQLGFLETNPDFVFCAHNHFMLYGKNDLEAAYPEIKEDFLELSTEDYLLNPHFHTASYFFRSSALPDPFPQWYPNVLAGDHFLVLFLSLAGKLGFLNERMSVFRVGRSGVTENEGPLRIKRNFVRHLSEFDEMTDRRFHDTIETVKRRWELVYKVYEPVGYFTKLRFFLGEMPFYLRNFRRSGGFALPLKYLLPMSAFQKLRGAIKG